MLPSLAPEGGFALACCRGLAVASMLGVFGTAAFRLFVARGVGSAERGLQHCLIGFAAGGLPLLALWTLLQSANFAGTGAIAAIGIVPQVLGQTAFGRTIVLEAGGLLLLSGIGIWLWRQAGIAFAVALGVVLLHIRQTHAGAEHAAVLAVSEQLHVTAAGAWLGSFVPLIVALRRAGVADATRMLRRYQGYGAICVVALLITAPIQYDRLIGSLPALVGTGYGLFGLAKLLLFLGLLGFAAANRWRLGPALERAGTAGAETARRHLLWSIGIETGIGLAVVLAAATMAQSAPGMHQQPIWPFAARFSLVTVDADSDFKQEALLGGIELVAAIGLACLAAALRHWLRYAALAAAIALPFLAAPHLALLSVPANPDSFFQSTSGFTDASIARGAALYPANCAGCHGAGGHGDGEAGAGLPVPPADLTAPHLWEHSDGDLFWWLAHGMVAPNGRQAMPGFAATLSEDDRWALIDFIRARNAGDTQHPDASGLSWAVTLTAPEIALDCGAGPGPVLSDLRGQFVLLAFGPVAPAPDVVRTIWADPHARPMPGICAAADPATETAYAIATGQGALDGASVVVDPQGRLRAVRPGGFGGGLAAAVARIGVTRAPAEAMTIMRGM